MIVALQTLIFFRESLLAALDRFLQPYYKHLTLAFTRSGNVLEDEESDEQVYADYDDEKGVTFFPPMYAQRYAAVSDCLMNDRWCGKIEKIVDFGHHDMSFIKYLKEVPGIRRILGVDIETIPLRCSSDLFGGDEYAPKRESPLEVVLFQGNAADPDYRLIGCDAVVAIEMIEHMLPHDLDRLVHTVFGFIKPWVVIFTTPNADFNVLFKALEKNGLRRWDHLFEWTREQFHDWCSNIIVRYPNYTVTCQGIGPGPPGTLHHGCCSQLSLFVSKDYQKQADLHLNSLALVANGPSPNNFSEVFGGWESSIGTRNDVDVGTSPLLPNDTKSLTEVIYPEKHSHMTLVISSTLCDSVPSSEPTLDTFTYRDQTLQCNLDSEIGKSFMMFDYEEYYHVLVPRRRVSHKVYEIEDVYSRLNCTTLQVKKFSKTTQNLMAKNRVDSLVHTREVVNEIRHLTKMLNFNKFSQGEDGAHVWCNINWGDNAPYWNQYYKIVREYIYPFETKSEEVRILDLVSNEINRLIDTQYDEEFTVDVNRLEIPLSHLMSVVQHITNDVDKVRDLLEWNGYDIVNDVVIHSRLVVDATSVATHEEEWQDNDTFSDWASTDIHSTSFSDGSTIVPDIPGRCLRRALDQKVRNLRTMLTADEDITTELDRVVCRLMKLALQSSRGRQTPPPTRWMQCKLLDLLTLTEKSIGRRRKNLIENFPIKAIDAKHQDAVLEQDNRVKQIVEKYHYLIRPIEKMTNTDDTNGPLTDLDIDDEFMSTTSNEFMKDYEDVEDISTSLVIPGPVFSTEAFETAQLPPDENPLERTKAWLDEDVEVVPYPNHEINYENISDSGDTDHSVSNARHKHKKSSKKNKTNLYKDIRESNTPPCKNSASKISYKLKIKRDAKSNKKKNSNTRIIKKVIKKKSCYNSLVKNPGGKYSAEYDNYIDSRQRENKEYKSFNVTASKPIPESIINLCHPELKAEKAEKIIKPYRVIDATEKVNIVISNTSCKISATEEDCLINIVMREFEETVALRRTIGTDAEAVPETIRQDLSESISNEFDKHLGTKYEVSTENVQSQTIFLNDINEPSTSKGIRHNISTDVQCGPDAFATYPMLSASTSLIKMSQVFSAGIKIHDVGAETKRTDFGTSTQDNDILTTITPKLIPVGIKIKDSDIRLHSSVECSTMTIAEPVPQIFKIVTHTPASGSSAVNSALSLPETRLIKPISSTLKIEDSESEFCASSVASSAKTLSYDAPKIPKHGLIESSVTKGVVTEKSSTTTCVRPKLCCGGVHIHSYRDKQISEDIVYQGEWQRCRPKAFTRKRTYNFSTLRKVNEAVSRKIKENLNEKKEISKERVLRKKQEKKQIEVESTKPTPIRNFKLHKVRQEDKNDQIKKSLATNSSNNISSNSMKIPKPIKTKVASKIAMSAITSKNAKSTFTLKRPVISPHVAVKKENDKPQKLKKSYIPLYLKRTAQLSARSKDKLNKSFDSAIDIIKATEEKVANQITPLVRSKTEDIRKDLLEFSDEVRENISYSIFRNELEDNFQLSDEQSSENSKDHNKNTAKHLEKRSNSPQSFNSSTCSSPNSIATVRAVATRAKNISNRRYSASSHKSNLTNSESENPSPTKTKKVIKRCKTAKKTENKDIDNKENIPQSTKKIYNKDKDKITKPPFVTRPKSVYIAQIKNDSSSPTSTLSRHKAQISNKSSLKIPARKEEDDKLKLSRPTVSKKRSSKSDTSSIFDDLTQNQSESCDSSDSTNMVLVLEPQPNCDDFLGPQNMSQMASGQCAIKRDNNLIAEWVQNSSLHNHASGILNSMRQILEETLDVIVSPHGHHVDPKTLTLSRDKIQKVHVDKKASTANKSVIIPVESLNKSFLENDVENALNRTFDSVLGGESTISLNDTRLTNTDFDLLSLESSTSVSKYSEYYLADSEFNSSSPAPECVQKKTTSVQDIFERKEPQRMIQNTPGALAVQAFSGFSLDAEPVAGDRIDSIALIDSETGSLALEITRQATSEELFTAGRSSDSYDSCLIDEDTVVPNWLFQLINQQQPVEEDQQPGLGPVAAPLDGPTYDANGNVIEQTMIGVSAGAGDGRGMHSDHSQDSSGRGTSLSSSDTSTGPQSEVSAILIDPSSFTVQYDLLRDPMASSAVVPAAPNHPLNHRLDDDAGTLIGSRDDRTRTTHGASDIDADVSSNDTDVLDSSDN